MSRAKEPVVVPNAAILLRSGYPAPVVAGILQMVAEGNREVCGLTPTDFEEDQ